MARFSARSRAYLADFLIAALLVMVSLTLGDQVTPSPQLGRPVVWVGMIGLTIAYIGPFMLGMGRRQALWDLPVHSMVCERRALGAVAARYVP